MLKYQNLLKLLAQKKQEFLRCEALTESLLTLPLEEVESAVENRQAILDYIVKLDAEIKAQNEKEEKSLLNILNHESERDGLSEDEGAIYDASLAVKAVVARIQAIEPAVVERFTLEQNYIQEQIEKMNQSSYVVAEKYQKSLQTGSGVMVTDQEKYL